MRNQSSKSLSLSEKSNPYSVCLSSLYNYKDITWSSSIFTYLSQIGNYSTVTLTNFQRLKSNWLKIEKSNLGKFGEFLKIWVSNTPSYLSIRDTCAKSERHLFKWGCYEQKPLFSFAHISWIERYGCVVETHFSKIHQISQESDFVIFS